MQRLEFWFEKANLPLIIENNSLSTKYNIVSNPNIFQLTIDTRKSKNQGNDEEYFRMYLGHKNNDVRVIDYDSKKRQVLLLVKEPSRGYKRKYWDPKKNVYKEIQKRTPDFKRKYLMGMDELHLFISELPVDLEPVNKIKDAHRILKPILVIKKEKDKNRIKRQGEWFFIPVNFKEQKLIEKNEFLIKTKIKIGKWMGQPHLAEKLLNIKINKGNKKKETIIFVKGRITHVDHKTLNLHGWYRVERNTEIRTDAERLERLTQKNSEYHKNIKRQDNALFFLASKEELNIMNKYKVKVRKNTSMGNGWKNSYIAEKLLWLKGNKSKTVKNLTLVSGEIRNKNHKSIRLQGWFRVERDPNYVRPEKEIKEFVRISFID